MFGNGYTSGSAMGFTGGMDGWLLMLGGILMVVALITLVVWSAGQRTQGSQTALRAAGGDEPSEILRRRLASGEISRDEYVAARQTIGAER